jgi:hypothetical protein
MRLRSDEPERTDKMSWIPGARSSGVLGRWRAEGRWGRLVAAIAIWLTVIVVAAVVAVVSVHDRAIGLGLAAMVVGLGLLIADPLLLVVLGLPGALLIQRVGGSGTNLSAADLIIFIGALVALFHVRWDQAPNLRRFMRGIVWFQMVLILTVVAHPFRDNIIEWFHRWSYVGGSVLVGWVIATYGRTKQAFRLFLAGSSLLAVIAMEHALTSHFQPAQWSVYQKNGIGAIMWIAILIAQINPPWTGIGRTEARLNKYLCIGGLLASQSRQEIILLILGIAASYVLNPELRGRAKLLMVFAIPAAVVLYFSFSNAAKNNPKFNSVSVRVDQIGAAIHVWHLSPLLGEGMRFYNLPQFITVTAPPNVLIDNLASSGILGSVAFFFMVVISLWVLYRVPYTFGTLGLVILAGHYIDGLFDIFWIGASSIAPFVIAGISVGMADLDLTKRGITARTDDRRSMHRLTHGSLAGIEAEPAPPLRGGRQPVPDRHRMAAAWCSARSYSVDAARAAYRILPAR